MVFLFSTLTKLSQAALKEHRQSNWNQDIVQTGVGGVQARAGICGMVAFITAEYKM